jgi:type IV secretion system protein VirB10
MVGVISLRIVHWALALAMACVVLPLRAADPDHDFSGTWRLDRRAGNLTQLVAVDESISITQGDAAVEYTAGGVRWTVPLNGTERKSQLASERWNSAAKWEGTALLVNSLVTGSRDYTVMDRWQLSPDHQTLTITRQILRGPIQSDGVLVYRRPGAAAQASAPLAADRQYVVPGGTKILLSLLSSLNTKGSREGDPVYLETSFPVTIEGRIVIPKGATVTGTVTNSKRPGKVAGKGELFIRFDNLTLPNGVTRNFRARLDSADGADVDRTEGSVRGPGNRAGDAKTVGIGAGTGATVGGAIGRSAGAAGLGGAAGAAAGLAGVLLKRGPDATLPRGTQVEMVLDRDLVYRAAELPR